MKSHITPLINGSLLLSALIVLTACGDGDHSLLQEEVPPFDRVDAFYMGYAECTGEPSLTMRSLASTTLGVKIGTCIQGQLVYVSDTRTSLDSDSALYANTGMGWANTRWLRKVSLVEDIPVGCLRSYDIRYSQAYVEKNTNAMLSLIGNTEGTGSCYNFMVGHKTFASFAEHPNLAQPFGSQKSTAAGRYQFLYGTWQEVSRANGFSTFAPVNQDVAATYYMDSKGFATPSKFLSKFDFEEVMDSLSYSWASLPPGRYGQPSKTMEQAWTIYQRYRDQ